MCENVKVLLKIITDTVVILLLRFGYVLCFYFLWLHFYLLHRERPPHHHMTLARVTIFLSTVCVFVPAVSCTQVVILCMRRKLHTAWQSCNTVETDWKIQTLHVHKYVKKGKGVKNSCHSYFIYCVCQNIFASCNEQGYFYIIVKIIVHSCVSFLPAGALRWFSGFS